MKLKNIIYTSLCTLALASCSDDFMHNPAQGSLSEEIVTTPENIDLIITSAYAVLNGKTNEMGDPWCRPVTNWSFGEVRSDNALKGGGGEGDQWETHAMETFNLETNNGFIDGKWFLFASQLSRVNNAIRALKAISPQDYPNRDLRIAEMKVLRSHFYFEFVRFFNQVPYVTEDTPHDDYATIPNNVYSRDEHLSRIAAELLEAAKDLPDRQDEVGRMNANIARAYAAKVKLYQAYKQDPQTHKTLSIDKDLMNEVVTLIDGIKGYSLLSDFQQLDLVAFDNGQESVFAIQHSLNDGTSDGGRVNWSNLLNSPGGDSPYHGDGFFLPSQDIINAYQTDENGLPEFDYQQLPDYCTIEKFETYKDDAGNDKYTIETSNTDHFVDPRLDFVIGRPNITWKTYSDSPCGSWVRDRGVYGHFCIKRFWVSPESPDMYPGWPWGASALNWQVIRYADLLLYKAEALIELDRLDEARACVNQIRQRAMNSTYVKDFNDPSKDAANYKIGLYTQAWTDKEYARKALRTEMRLEKAFEGERYFDLVRWGIAGETMTKYFENEKRIHIYYDKAHFDAGEEYFAIPVAQYNFTGIYVQNPGYPAF